MKKFLLALFLLLPLPTLAQLSLSTAASSVVNAPIDANGWRSFKVLLTQNATFSFVILPNGTPPPAQSIMTVEFLENATGGFNVTFASNINSPCTISTGANVVTICQFVYDSVSNIWTGIGGSGNVSGSYGPLAFSCTGCNPNVQYAFAVTCNSGSQTITTGANDPPFVSSDVTKIIVGTSASNAAAGCPPQGTITVFGGAHSVTVSNAATQTTTTGVLGWGSQDDGPNLRNSFLSSLGKGCLYLPVGAMFAGAAGSDSVNLFVDNRSASVTGMPPCVIGQANTIITPLPAFNFSSCFANDACLFRFSQATNANPNYGLFKDTMLLLLSYNLTGSGASNGWVDWQRVTLENIWLWTPSPFTFGGMNLGFFGAGPTSAFSPISFNAASTACQSSGTGNTSAGLNQLVTLNQGYCQGSNLSLNVGGALKTQGMQFGSGGSGPTITAGGIWDSWGDGIFKGNGTADSLRITGGSTYLHGGWVAGGAGNTLGAVDCNASGATVTIDGTAVDGGGSGGLALRSVAGCNIKVRFPVTVPNYAASLAGNNISDPSETQTGACTTNAATVTFKLTYQVAPLVLVSDTTSASTGAQATAINTTTATIHCNGASDTFTATVIPNPI